MSTDPSIWRLSDLGPVTTNLDEMTLADDAIVYWDMANRKDIDSEEAASHLAAFIMGGKSSARPSRSKFTH